MLNEAAAKNAKELSNLEVENLKLENKNKDLSEKHEKIKVSTEELKAKHEEIKNGFEKKIEVLMDKFEKQSKQYKEDQEYKCKVLEAEADDKEL